MAGAWAVVRFGEKDASDTFLERCTAGEETCRCIARLARSEVDEPVRGLVLNHVWEPGVEVKQADRRAWVNAQVLAFSYSASRACGTAAPLLASS